jgi:(1->4)-alpha-D-glucan 1-alpha-D-glucosylmutase
MYVPTATYRLQFGPSFGFKDAETIVPYLHKLGISDIYASPVFKANKGSTHGYDVTNPNELNPELVDCQKRRVQNRLDTGHRAQPHGV